MHHQLSAAMAANHRRELMEQARLHRLARQHAARRARPAPLRPEPELVAGYGGALVVRPIEGGDVDRLARLFRRLSPRSIYTRFFLPIRSLPTSTFETFARVDHDRREALVALDGDEIVAVARYDDLAEAATTSGRVAEIAVTVDDAWQHCGVGRVVTTRLGRLAAERGIDTFVATVLPDNRAALRLIDELAPDAQVVLADDRYRVTLPLAGSRQLN